ncbi:MAG: hypothetical protein KAG97_08535, partial [Victivallales bacterium]|nr:hypothetical protein [Victivallales bacterium]
CEIERSMDVARRKTKIARYISEADDKIAKCPDSSDLKELKADLDRLCDEYLAVSKEINKKIQERSEIEKSMRRRRDELYEKFRAEKKKNGCSFRKKKKSKKCK